ncbi:MAG: T9SS type A sorting domain-containing protein [Bacteroidota bacterium]
MVNSLQINSLITKAEAYPPRSTPHDLVIAWDSETAEWSLSANIPNPFSQRTTIQGFAAQEGRATLRVMNAQGQEIWQKKRFLPVGPFKWILAGDDLGEAGVYYYQLITEHQTLTRKMIYTK